MAPASPTPPRPPRYVPRMRLALVLPPLTQLNAPYPATAYLARTLRDHGIACTQRDLGIEWVLRLYSRQGLAEVFDSLADRDELPEPGWRALALRAAHLDAIEPVIRFLQGRDRTLAPRILDTPFLPRGPRLGRADLEGFGPLATDDAARHLATLYLEDLADLVTSCVDEGFSLIRYQHHLAVGQASFDPIATRLAKTTLLDRWLDTLTDTLTDTLRADVVGITVPFPGNLYGALRIGQRLRRRGVHVILGGGYINTELRDTEEPRLWECVDALVYDDGEGPLLAALEQWRGGADQRYRIRTRDGLRWDPLRLPDTPTPPEPPPDVPAQSAAWYGDLRLDLYLQLVDSLNPAHRLWSDGRWNKITLAHGCYWRKCSFCDIQLDYISRYAPARTEALADAMEGLIADTGQSGFHMVDEAAPPRGMRDLALEILKRGMTVTWWGNIRFEAAFTPDLCRLFAASGLVAVTGGLEVASDRLLLAMEKGVTIEQVARAASAFRGAGVLVHAYLMYGFPTQTEEDTVDSLEIVRQLFAHDLVSSAFWHRFVLTRHSGVARDPARYGVAMPSSPDPSGPPRFATNDLPHGDPTGADHDRFDDVLPRALAAWMRGRDLDKPVNTWFSPALPPSREPADRVARALDPAAAGAGMGERLVWLGGEVLTDGPLVILHTRDGTSQVRARRDDRAWLAEVLDAALPARAPLRFADARAAFPGDWDRFSATWLAVRQAGLVGV